MYMGLALLLLLVSSSGAWARLRAEMDDFNPTNPPEPNANFTITVTSDHGYTSGSGTYVQGNTARISVSSRDNNYTFAYWTKNGKKYTGTVRLYTTEGTSYRYFRIPEVTEVTEP